MRTIEELTQLAKDLWSGSIYTSQHVSDPNLVKHVFMPLIFLGEEGLNNLKEKNIVVLFEYMDKAQSRSINGCPIFMSMQCLNSDEWVIVVDKYESIKKKMSEI